MQTSSYFSDKVKQNFHKIFDKTVINRIGSSSNFVRRKAQKITATDFILGFIESCSTGCYTYSQWAASISHLSGKVVSKQGLYERVSNTATVDFAKNILAQAISGKIGGVTNGFLFNTFKRVLLQDSTTLSLPQCLSMHYPGNVSRGEQKAVARLQCLINIKTMRWLNMELQPFTCNDQSASATVLPVLKKGDLLIRDLGYFVLDVFKKIEQHQAFYISRLRYGVTLYDTKGRIIDWKQLCRQKGITDQVVFAGAKQKLKLRIIMVPLPEAQAAEKIRKARADRDARVNHSKDYYVWLRYNVFITNVSANTLSAEQIAQVYKVRWQIEILFKAWKTGLHLQKILHQKCTNIHRVQTSIYLVLMFFCLIVQQVYMPYDKTIFKQVGKYLSLIKVCNYIWLNPLTWMFFSAQKLKQLLTKYCCYETRNNRTNMTELIRNTIP